jgi:hypothetical protein
MSKLNIITVQEKKRNWRFFFFLMEEMKFFFDNPGTVSNTYRNPRMIRAFNGAGDITRTAEKFLLILL